MNAERQQILEMLANGKITAEQADQLLDAVQPDEPARADEWTAPRQETRRPRPKRRADPALQKLAEASMHGVNSKFIAEMRAAGYNDLTLDQLIEMRIHGVDAAFVEEMQQLGYPDLTPEDLVEMRIHGVNTRFVQEMREAGYADVAPEDLVKLQIHGVSGEDVREMRGLASQSAPSEEE